MTPFRLSSRVSAARAHDPPRGRARRDFHAPGAPGSSGVLEVVPVPVAHPVPWRVTRRSGRGVIEFEQLGDGPLRAVRATLAGRGMLGLSLPRTVHPGERFRVVLRGAGVEGAIDAPDAMLVLRWFQVDGTELLWPVAL